MSQVRFIEGGGSKKPQLALGTVYVDEARRAELPTSGAGKPVTTQLKLQAIQLPAMTILLV